jgi:hypothetical protein
MAIFRERNQIQTFIDSERRKFGLGGDRAYLFAGAANCTIAAGTGGIASLPSS